MKELSVTVIAQASRRVVEHTGSDSYRIHVTAPAQKGKANKQMLKLLSKELGFPLSRLMIARGDRSSHKTVLVLDE